MPAEKWIIEPANAFKQKICLPPDKYDDFNTLNHLSLVTIIRQLSQLSLISNKLFEELLTDCSNLSKRTIKLNKKIKQLNELTTKFNAKKVKIPISSIEKCRSIKDHYTIEQIIDQKLFTNSSRPNCLIKCLEFINKLDQEEKIKPIITSIDLNEPIYTGLPIKLIKKRKLDLLDIETQQPNNIINIKLPRDDIVRRAQTPLCKSMVQLHSRPLDDIYNLTESDNLDHLMLSSNHPLHKIKENQEKRRNSLRTSRSTGLIHQRSTNFKEQIKNQILNDQLNSTTKTKNLESNHYCCTNISTGLTEINTDYANDFQNRFNNNQFNNQVTSQLLALDNSTMTIIKKCSSCSTNDNSISNLTCSCASSNEPIYMLPSLKEQTEALSKEYPSNVVAINTDQIQFTRMSSFRKSLIHSDFNIKRKKLKLGNKENSKLKRRNTICESICHQRNCNLNHCSKKKCCTTTNTLNIKNCDQNKLDKLDKQTDRRRSTGSINLIDSCCQTDLTLGINTQSINRLNNQSTTIESTNPKHQQVIKYNNYTNINGSKVKVKAEIHNFKQESMYAKINKKSNEDERSSSGNSSAASSTCATSCSTTTKSPTHNDELNRINRESQPIKDIAKRNSYSACSLSSSQKFNEQQIEETGCLKNNSEINVINSEIRLNDQNENGFLKFRQQPQNIKYANRDSKESWLQFFESNESTDTITNEINNETNLDNKIKNSKKDIQSNDVNHQRKFKPNRKRNELDSITNLEEHEDELLSIHSEDTDGYYTSMHTDSGLFRERAQQLPPMNSTFISNDLNEKDDKKLDKQNQSTKQQITIKKDDNLMNDTLKKKLIAPSPPPRGSSSMSNSSTLNNIQQLTSLMSNQTTYDDNSSVCSDATLSGHTNSSSQQYNSKSTANNNVNEENLPKTSETIKNIPSQVQERQQNINRVNDFHTSVASSLKSPSPANTWCSSMNSDTLDLVKLRNKTIIDVTGYPSMVAYPDSELSSLSSFGNLAFALSGNHRCTVISKSHNDNNYSNCINQFKNNASQTPQLSKRDSTSSLDSKLSKRSLSTIGSYASLTKLKLLLKPLRNSLMKSGEKSNEKKTNENKVKQSKDDCLIDEEKSNKRKGFFTRFGSINRGKIVKSSHLEKLEKNTSDNEKDQDDMIKLRNTINKWRIEPISQEIQMNKVLNKNTSKDTNTKQQFLEEDENEYYAKLSQQSSNILRNSVDYSLNNDLKRFSIASNNSQITAKDNNESYLLKKQQLLQEQTLGVNKLSSSLNQPLTRSLNQSSLNKEKRNSDAALFTKLFPISRYTSKVQPEDHQFIVPSLPTPSYYENVANTRFSYSSDNGCSNSLALSNNSSLYSTIPNRPKTLNLSASLSIPFNQQQQQPIYGQTILSNSYNCTFNNNSMNRPFLNNYQLINGQSLTSSTSSSFNPQLPLIQNSNIPNVNMLNNYLNQPIYHQPVLYQQQQQQQTINHQQNLNNHHNHHFQQASSISSHQSTSSNASYNYLSSNTSSNANTPSSISSSSPLHQQTSQLNQIKKANNNQFKSLPVTTLQSANTAIVSPFCTNNNTQQSTDSLKKSEEKLKDLKDNNQIIKRSTDDSVLTKIESRTLNNNNINQIQFRDSMRLSRQQREQTLARIQRSSWTPSSSIISSPSDSLGSSSNSSTDQSTTINDINKLISELSNFNNVGQHTENDNKKLNEELNNQLNGKNEQIYGVNIARTRLPLMQTTVNENSIKGDLNILKQSNGTNINEFKKLLSSKTKSEINGLNKKSASEQLKIIRKPLSALTALEAVNEKLNENDCLNNYEKETYDNVTDEENENQNREIDNFKQSSNNSSLISLMNGQSYYNDNINGYSPNLRTRVINGRVYKTPYNLKTMYHPPINEELPEINEEENNEDGEFIVTNNQQNTSTWV